MPAEYGYCPDCGREMKALARSIYCPNDCDRAPEFIDFEITQPSNIACCPKCKSTDIESFFILFYNMHCIDCGACW